MAERRYWLMKTEPTTFSFDDLWNAPKRTTSWDGVRNYTARNMMRDQMKKGDLVFIYHSSADPTGIAGIAEVAREGYPDESAFDPEDSHYDPKSKRDNPSWYLVDVKAVKAFREIVTLESLRKMKGLEKMTLLQKGSRLSVQPVTPGEWELINSIAKGQSRRRESGAFRLFSGNTRRKNGKDSHRRNARHRGRRDRRKGRAHRQDIQSPDHRRRHPRKRPQEDPYG